VANLCNLMLCAAVAIMAVSKLKWCVTEITTCPVCLEEYFDAKSLPCVHSFCLKCIEGHCKDKLPGQSADCPVCRTEFKIPENGIVGLPHNFFLKNLVDAKKGTGEIDSGALCDVCVKEDADELDVVPAATVYCVECNQKLCKPCSRTHKRYSGGRSHQLRKLADIGKSELLLQRRSRCEKHELKLIELYCFDCKENLCMKCFAVSHRHHKCGEIEQVADDLSEHIDADIKQVQQRLYTFTAAMSKVEDQSANFHANAEKIENEIAETGEKLKQLVDKCVNNLQQYVRQFKAANMKDIDDQKGRLSLALVAMESYTKYATELKNKGSHSDITTAAAKLHSRANELLQTYVVPDDCCAPPKVAFTPSHNVDDLVQNGQGIIGCVNIIKPAGTFCSALCSEKNPLMI